MQNLHLRYYTTSRVTCVSCSLYLEGSLSLCSVEVSVPAPPRGSFSGFYISLSVSFRPSTPPSYNISSLSYHIIITLGIFPRCAAVLRTLSEALDFLLIQTCVPQVSRRSRSPIPRFKCLESLHWKYCFPTCPLLRQ